MLVQPLILTRKIEIDYGHTLPNHFSFCNQLHGHRATVIATISGNVCTDSNSSSEGMVYDFKILKELMMQHLHGVLDHGFAVWEKSTDDLNYIKTRNTKILVTSEPPTAEYLAKWAYFQLNIHLPKNIILEKIEWFETPNASAIFSKENL